jgi:hypothetical protein
MTIKITAQDIADAVKSSPNDEELDLGNLIRDDGRKTAVRRAITIGSKSVFFVPEALVLRFVVIDSHFPHEKIFAQTEERAAQIFNDGV